MKKFLAILLAALMVVCSVALVSCSEETEQEQIGKSETTTFRVDTGTFTYNSLTATTLEITAYNGKNDPHELVIPETMNGKKVVSIGFEAFHYNSSLTKITLPDSVISIADFAFAGCATMKEFVMGNGVTTIGAKAFYECTAMESITFSNALTAIGDSAFYHCSALKSINLPSSLKTIADSAFLGCSSVTTLVIPQGVTEIGRLAFYNCNLLMDITIPTSVESMGKFVFGLAPEELETDEDNQAIAYAPTYHVEAGSYAEHYVNNTLDELETEE